MEDFDDMLRKQDYKCAICRCNFKKRCVDHDHTTGVVRGLLCDRCNMGIGKLKDKYEVVQNAADYLSMTQANYFFPPTEILKHMKQSA